MTWTLIEPCCGSASISTHICGAFKRWNILPYQGSKWKLRKPIHELLISRGFTGVPDQVFLSDIGPWGKVWQGLTDPKIRSEIISFLEEWSQEDPKKVYDRTHNGEASEDLGRFAAEYLFLQRLAFSGKAVSPQNGVWKSPGFNHTSAYGNPASDSFGAVNPMLPSLIRTLKTFRWETTENWTAHQGSASDIAFPVGPRTVVYFDPPYAGTTLYPAGDLSRSEVVRLAQEWSDRGALVVISEGEAVEELGWESTCLIGDPGTGSPFRGNSPEWLTYNQVQMAPQALNLEDFFRWE